MKTTYKFAHCRSCKMTVEIPEQMTPEIIATVRAGCGCTGSRWVGLKFRTVYGTKKDTVKCGGPCVNAIGSDCECSCGGENHGRYA